MSDVELSIVVPVHDEALVLRELVARCVSAASATRRTFEVVLVDDASVDETPEVAASLSVDARVRVVRLDRKRGQFGATRVGLLEAHGVCIAVLDGDLQDPPEHIPALVDAWRAHPSPEAVAFAVKERRDDPVWFLWGRRAYVAAQRVLGETVPEGAGSYCLMSRVMARRVSAIPLRHANLAAVLVALGARPRPVPYAKQARYDRVSRVGTTGLIREALGSLLLLAPPVRWALRRRLRRERV